MTDKGETIYKKWLEYNEELTYRYWIRAFEPGIIESPDTVQNETRASLPEYQEVKVVPIDAITILPEEIPAVTGVWIDTDGSYNATIDGTEVYGSATAEESFAWALRYFALSYEQGLNPRPDPEFVTEVKDILAKESIMQLEREDVEGLIVTLRKHFNFERKPEEENDDA